MSDLTSLITGTADDALTRAQAEQQLADVTARLAELEADKLLLHHIRTSYFLTPLQWKMKERNATFRDLEQLRIELHSVKYKELQLQSYITDLIIEETRNEIAATQAKATQS